MNGAIVLCKGVPLKILFGIILILQIHIGLKNPFSKNAISLLFVQIP